MYPSGKRITKRLRAARWCRRDAYGDVAECFREFYAPWMGRLRFRPAPGWSQRAECPHITLAAKQCADRAGAGRLVSFLENAHLLRNGKNPATRAVRNFRISRTGWRHDSRPSASFYAVTHGGYHLHGPN